MNVALLDGPKTVGRPRGKPTKTVRAFEQTAEDIERVADTLGLNRITLTRNSARKEFV